MWFNHKNPELQEDRIFISMPGVPHEMKGMMSHYILPKLKQQFNLTPIIHKTLITAGIGESFLAERIQDFESALPDSIKLAYLPNYGMVKLRLTATDNKSETEGELLGLFEDLKHSLTDVLVTDQDQSLQEVVGNLLIKSGKTLSTIESCTGGYVSHLLTSIAGSSVYFHGSIVCYSNEIKKNLIDVPPAILEQHGAVSEETIRFMLEGGLKKMKTDYVLATSGIMGPSGGSADKPLGTVWIGVANKNKMHTKKFHFRFDRSRNIELTATNALNNLRKLILEELETI
jgi:nicotinamide-nucleotide amidase